MGTKTTVVTLEDVIERGENKIGMLALRKPASGELRGLSLADITMLKTDALIELIPRISSPPITEAEVSALDPADLFKCAIEIAGFFLPKGMQPEALADVSGAKN